MGKRLENVRVRVTGRGVLAVVAIAGWACVLFSCVADGGPSWFVDLRGGLAAASAEGLEE